jgi:hypothetical protein
MATTERRDDTEASRAGSHLGTALLVVCGAQLVIVLDSAIVNVALPIIPRDLNSRPSTCSEWSRPAHFLTQLLPTISPTT